MANNFWGKHYLVDAYGCSDAIKNRDAIYDFTKELIQEIDMVAHGEPMIEHFATHDPEKGGYTLSQMISTSLIDAHFVDATGKAFFSVHSCKEFEPETVKEVITRYFSPTRIFDTLVYRGVEE